MKRWNRDEWWKFFVLTFSFTCGRAYVWIVIISRILLAWVRHGGLACGERDGERALWFYCMAFFLASPVDRCSAEEQCLMVASFGQGSSLHTLLIFTVLGQWMLMMNPEYIRFVTSTDTVFDSAIHIVNKVSIKKTFATTCLAGQRYSVTRSWDTRFKKWLF